MKKMKCLVCGMTIKAEAYNLNEHSFIEKNEQNNINYCPFCGVGRLYFDDKIPVYNIEQGKLDAETIKILDHAMKLEVFNGEFYEEASKLAESQAIKKMFKDLSHIEFMHAKIHKRLGGFTKLPQLHKPDYSRHKGDDLLLEEAHKREQHAIAYYEKNGQYVSSNMIQEVFKALAEVETQHMSLTDKSESRTLSLSF